VTQKQTQREEGHEKREVEIEIVPPQTEQYLEPPEAERGKEGASSRASMGTWPHQHLHFRLLNSKTVREYISAVLSHPFVAPCCSSHRKLMQSLFSTQSRGKEVNVLFYRWSRYYKTMSLWRSCII
jgi:hypothetical protein